MSLLRVLLLWGTAVLCGVGAAAEQEGLADVRAAMDAGRLDEAVQRVDGFLAAHPEDPDARFLKGLILVQQERSDEAIVVFTGLTADYPNLPEPYNNLAVLYAASGDYEKAREALLVAIRTHPSYATAHENLGDLYAKMAAVAYDRALVLDQENRAAQSKLAMVNELFSEHTSSPAPVRPRPEPGIGQNDAAATQAQPQPPAKPPAPPSTGLEVEQEVIGAALDWAAAWSAQDVDAYLGYYAPEFSPPKNLTRRQWEAQRRERLRKPSYIEVTMLEPQVRMESADLARLTFVQRYHSNTYSDRTRKALVMSRGENGWRILSEQAVR